jgi:hypothetical protein
VEGCWTRLTLSRFVHPLGIRGKSGLYYAAVYGDWCATTHVQGKISGLMVECA